MFHMEKRSRNMLIIIIIIIIKESRFFIFKKGIVKFTTITTPLSIHEEHVTHKIVTFPQQLSNLHVHGPSKAGEPGRPICPGRDRTAPLKTAPPCC